MPNDPNTPFKLNLPMELKELLSEKAKQQHRSLTGEMIYRLQQSCEIDLEKARRHAAFLVVHLENEVVGDDFTRKHVSQLYAALGVNEEDY